MNKRKGKNKNCSFHKSEIDLCKMWCGLMMCRAMLEKIPYMQKRHMDIVLCCVGQCWKKCHICKKDIWMSL